MPGADHVMIGRASGIERDFAASRRSCRARSRRLRPMIAQAADPDRARLAEGPLAGAAAELPLPAELLGLCDHRTSTLWGRARRMARAQAHHALPPVGRPGPRPGTMTRILTGEREQEHDPRGRAERAGAARLELCLANDSSRPPTRRRRKVENGQAKPLPPQPQAQPRPPEHAATALRSRAAVLGATPRVRIETPSPPGLDQPQGRAHRRSRPGPRSANASPRTPRRCGCLSPPARPAPISPSFGWSGQGVAAPRRRRGVDRERDRCLTPGKPVTLSWTSPDGRASSCIIVGRRQLSVHRPAARHQRRPRTPIAVAPVRAGQPRRPSRPILTAGPIHVGPIGVFGGTANYDVDWEDLDEAPSGGSNSPAVGGWLGFTDKYWLTALAPAGSADVAADFRTVAERRLPGRLCARRRSIVAPGPDGRRPRPRCSPAPRRRRCSTAMRRRASPSFRKSIDWGWFEWFMRPIFDLLIWLFKTDRQFRRGDHLPDA